MTDQNKVQWVYSASDNDDLAKRYDQWASTYDQDLEQDFDWTGHVRAVQVFIKFVTPDSTVIDVGCGTGLAGSELKAQGFTHIDGFDMSQGMLQQARLLDIYGDLKINILGETLDYSTASYDAAIATGVFSVGHAPASGWGEVARIVKPGGYFVLTMRPDIFESSGFQDKESALVGSRKWQWMHTTEPAQFLAKGEPSLLHEIRVYQILK
jgi:predicted TPR repeat methyltransferase